MSRKSPENLSQGLWRVVISWVKGRPASNELRPGRALHWFRWSRPLEWAPADSLTAMTRSRILNIPLRNTIM